jgi:hypothetical protein
MSDKDTNPKDALGIAKVPMHCVSARVMMELGLAMMEGGRKYGTHNYRKMGVRGSVYYDATMRHMMAYWEGQDIDPDSGVHHVIKAIATLVVMRDSMLMENFEDDRPIRLPKGLDIDDLNEQAAKIIKKYPQCKMPFIEAGPKKMEEEVEEKLDKVFGNRYKDVQCDCRTCTGIRKLEEKRLRHAGDAWSIREDDQLRDEVNRDLGMSVIALIHHRTDKAIECRMKKLNLEFKPEVKHEEGKTTYDNAVDGMCYNIDRLCKCDTCRSRWDQNFI